MTFAGESQARMRYTYWARVAEKEGYQQIAAIFLETADQEKEHAKRMFKFLEGGDVEITGAYPAGQIRSTLENLDEAAKGEEHEYRDLYPACAEMAEKKAFLKSRRCTAPLSSLKFSTATVIGLCRKILKKTGSLKRYSEKMALPQMRLRS